MSAIEGRRAIAKLVWINWLTRTQYSAFRGNDRSNQQDVNKCRQSNNNNNNDRSHKSRPSFPPLRNRSFLTDAPSFVMCFESG
jgi:hypothetical protein